MAVPEHKLFAKTIVEDEGSVTEENGIVTVRSLLVREDKYTKAEYEAIKEKYYEGLRNYLSDR